MVNQVDLYHKKKGRVGCMAILVPFNREIRVSKSHGSVCRAHVENRLWASFRNVGMRHATTRQLIIQSSEERTTHDASCLVLNDT